MTSNAHSKVQLTLMQLFRWQGTSEARRITPFVGTHRAWVENGQAHLETGSIPFHDRHLDALAPQSGRGLLALFGLRDALTELQHWRTVARNAQAQFASLQLQVDIGVPPAGVVTRSMLQTAGPALRFVNVKRCAAELQKQWLERFAQWVEEAGGRASEQMAHVRQMAERPDLFERLLWEDPDLAHIDVLVLPLADWPGSSRTRQVAYVRAGAAIVGRVQGSDVVQVHLPEWMELAHTESR